MADIDPFYSTQTVMGERLTWEDTGITYPPIEREAQLELGITGVIYVDGEAVQTFNANPSGILFQNILQPMNYVVRSSYNKNTREFTFFWKKHPESSYITVNYEYQMKS